MMALRVGKDLFDYINEVKVQKSRQAMKRRVQEYVPNQASVDKLERVDEKFYLIIFSADWCADCVAYVPGLAKTLVLAKNNMLTARVVTMMATGTWRKSTMSGPFQRLSCLTRGGGRGGGLWRCRTDLGRSRRSCARF